MSSHAQQAQTLVEALPYIQKFTGKTIVVTGNGIMQGTSEPPLPEGLMRYTLVLGDNDGRQQVVLFQATPVVPSTDCKDGNCALR